ncbi:tricarballylate utilization 4Fe-4S protein TcuB [Rhodoplanes sp. TEM]|uniref:Tricarballylate utilization 4Fe-4S protein TcuB n=1 Tax=Rhodoplanes tepidamans TaxID=200616 RepID=A0ABT5J8E4_RHOTP|nr:MULTISPECIES: tricarballylate utilization 4Fe-4S protein TcuB [Rhodoplanes]MDC7785877.1 tricarballylate utilization 4Fe-4S protein TcuB [Rhodoplanes tepidamans]MDC7984989.1 tricarballylate utilization 4Fe-4S protein TcuB [Rhodoplanes sp. TEM]MDQ0355505.1 citrate/tricarballylate utilization protein [Rhodoplanes tepidamans]
MPPREVVEEAERVLRLCSACMYCDGVCAVFPAIAGKATVPLADVAHIANLCHGCRGCWYACQYAPPHPFAVNVPQTLAAARRLSYADFSRPRWLAAGFGRRAWAVAAVAGGVTLLALLLVLLTVPSGILFGVHRGDGAFYRVVPWGAMTTAAGLSFLWAVGSIAASTLAFWRSIAPAVPGKIVRRALGPALVDIVTLNNLGGGGHGCNDAGERLSQERRIAHHAMVAGFALTVLSTLSAALWHHVAGVRAPYGFWSLPVLSGTAGGVLMLAGIAGLLALEVRADPAPAEPGETRLNRVFLTLLGLVAASGLAVLALRETMLMGLALTLHLGLVTGFFLVLPASKMLHAPFRAAALLRAAIDRIASPPRRSGGE